MPRKPRFFLPEIPICYANCCGKLGGAIGAGWVKTLQLAGSAAVTFRTTVAAVFGGMAAKASGGNFAQGAKTAAIQHLFNEELSELAAEGGIARFLDGAVTIDEVKDLQNILRSATSEELIELFPHLKQYRNVTELEFNIYRLDLSKDVSKIGYNALVKSLHATADIAENMIVDFVVGKGIGKVADYTDLSVHLIEYIEIAFMIGEIPHMHQERRFIIDDLRIKYNE